MRVGLGPVFACERSIASRRWQTYAARSFLLSSLLVAMATVAASPSGAFGSGFAREYAALGESYFYAMIGVELALVLLAAPAATAGAICLDRARGTLAHVFATDLSDAEIVLGKLAARLAPILALVAGTWPVMAISSLLGGIDPLALTLAFAVIMAVAALGCSLALVLSVWARRMHEVLLAIYVLWAIVLLAWPIWYGLSRGGVLSAPDHCLLVANPFYLAFAPYAAPGQIGVQDYLGFFAVVLSASVVAILVAVWRIRPVACRIEGEQRGARFGLLGRLSRGLPGPSLDRNPVLWREWHRLRPSAWMIALGCFVWGTTSLTCVIGACSAWRHGIKPVPGLLAAQLSGMFAYLILIFFGLLMLSAVAPSSMSEERQRGSLDVLVATPLSTTAILLGKWWGTFRLVPFLAIGPGLMALAMATARLNVPPTPVFIGAVVLPYAIDLSLGVRLGAAALLVATILTYGAALTSLGLALATWIKRQSRAIAASVSIFVLLAIGWPMLTMFGPARGAIGLRELSPIFSAGNLGEELITRSDRLGSTMWSVGLWDVAAAATAIGLCWLTARTFDDSFGRVRERPRTSHWMADVAVLVAGVTAAACLVNGVAIWAQGVNPRQFPDGANGTAAVLLLLLGLILVSLLAALMAPAEGALPRSEHGDSKARSSVAIVLGSWWQVFRMALLLAVAPGLIALALATAREFQPVIGVEDTTAGGEKAVMITTTTPSGETSRRLYTGDRSDANVQAALKELSVQNTGQPLGDRLRDAGLLMITIIAHGAAATSVGLALATWIKRRTRRIAAAVCVTLLVAVVWPIGVYFVSANGFNLRDGAYALSPVWAADYLMDLLTDRQNHPSRLLWWIGAWDGVVTLSAIGLLYLAVRTFERRLGAENDGASPIPRTAFAQRLVGAARSQG
jgi:ABC-type transport system involved in multi-copper enzyme maturation permease subunit